MILVDERVGSVHYAKLLNPSQVERLEYGDIAFEGNDKLIGIEIKKIADAIASLISGRYMDHQLPGMLGLYDRSYLLIEGYYRSDPTTGFVQTWQGSRSWKDICTARQFIGWQSLEGWLTSAEELGGIHIRRTTDQRETVATIQALYHWWQKSEHKSLHVFNTAQDAAAIERPGLLRRMAAQLPMIGWQRSQEVASHFKTVEAMAEADIGDWLEIDGIGKVIAEKVVKAIRG